MIKINCSECSNNCCANPNLTPVLLAAEEEIFNKFSIRIATRHRDMSILKKKENGSCIFLDDNSIRCTIYQERPLECRLYPFLLDFSKELPDSRLDKRFCPSLLTLTFDKQEINRLISEHEFHQDWISGYEELADY